MSKTIPERNMEGELAVAKPRSMCLISRNSNRGQTSSFGPDVEADTCQIRGQDLHGSRNWIKNDVQVRILVARDAKRVRCRQTEA